MGEWAGSKPQGPDNMNGRAATAAAASACSQPDPCHLAPAAAGALAPETCQDALCGRTDGRQLHLEPEGGGGHAGNGRGAARFVQAGEVGGQGRVVEAAAVEPLIEAAQGSGIGPAGVLAEGGPCARPACPTAIPETPSASGSAATALCGWKLQVPRDAVAEQELGPRAGALGVSGSQRERVDATARPSLTTG